MGGVIGGRSQTSPWKIDARFNKAELIGRIEHIAKFRDRVELCQMDALDFIEGGLKRWADRTLIYLDPPYYEKGRFLYFDAYRPEDHASIARMMCELAGKRWIVSYDDVRPIHELYRDRPSITYTLGYSARRVEQGREAMFFSDRLTVPSLPSPMSEISRRFAA